MFKLSASGIAPYAPQEGPWKEYTTFDKTIAKTYIAIMKWITCPDCGGRYIGKHCACVVFPWLVKKHANTLTAENISKIGTAKDIAKLHSGASALDALSRMEARTHGAMPVENAESPTITAKTGRKERIGKRRESA